MAFDGQTLVNDLSRRLRDTANLGYSRATVLEMLNRSQRSINAHLGLVTNEATFTPVNTPLISIPTIATDIVRIVEIRDDQNRVLTKVPWTHIVYQSDRWLRAIGAPQPEVFATIGRDLLVVIPVARIPGPLTAHYVRQTPDMADSNASFMVLPDEHKAIIMDLAEAMLCFRGRVIGAMQQALGRLTNALGIEDVFQTARRGEDMTHE